MEEIQLIGSKYVFHVIEAKILPERNLISDLLENTSGNYLSITQEEFDRILDYCKTTLTPLNL